MLRKYSYRSICCTLLLWIGHVAAAQDGKILDNMHADTTSVNKMIAKANALRARSETDSALTLLTEALHISHSLDFNAGIGGTMMSMAFCYQDVGAYQKSKVLLYQALPYCIRVAAYNPRALLSVYNGLGGTYMLLGKNDSAIHFFYQALSYMEQQTTADSFMRLQLYNNLGTAWLQKKNLNKSLKYHQQAADLAIKLKESLFLANIYANIGSTNLEQGDTLSAIGYLNKALDIYRESRNRKGMKFIYYALGNAQADQHQAIAYYQAALKADTSTLYVTGIYQGLGKAYYLLGDYRSAAPWYEQSEAICAQQGLLTHRLANYSALASIYSQLGDFKKAYNYQVAYSQLNDSLLNKENEQALNELEVKFRISEKDKILTQNKLQLSRQQQWIIGGGSASLLLIGLFIGFHQRSRYKQRVQAARIKSLTQQQKIDQLHAKMQGEEEERSRIARELHDGVNVLLSAAKMNYAALGKEVNGLPEVNSYSEVMGLLNDMGLELRTITYKLVPELLIQQSLPDAVETFCELIRKGKNLYIEFQSWGSFTALPAEYCFAIYRVLQELVHNIIKHAHATSALIQLRHQNDLLCLTVEDNGIGFDPDKTYEGLGLKSMYSRINDIGGQITFSSTKGEGTSVEVELMTNKHYQDSKRTIYKS